jgi:hypothetical protein
MVTTSAVAIVVIHTIRISAPRYHYCADEMDGNRAFLVTIESAPGLLQGRQRHQGHAQLFRIASRAPLSCWWQARPPRPHDAHHQPQPGELCIFCVGLHSSLLEVLSAVGQKTMISKAEHPRRTIAKIEAKLARSPHPSNQHELEVCLARRRKYLASYSLQWLERGARRPKKP